MSKEKNDLIHEFMAYKPHWDADFDWNWQHLIPVVERIENFELDDKLPHIEIRANECFISLIDDRGDETIFSTHKIKPTKIMAVYEAVVEFVEYYNSEWANPHEKTIISTRVYIVNYENTEQYFQYWVDADDKTFCDEAQRQNNVFSVREFQAEVNKEANPLGADGLIRFVCLKEMV